MPISMSTSAHYVTQQNVWGTQYGKTLTNRVIAKYQRLGYFSNGIVKAVVQNEKREVRRKAKLVEVFSGF